MKDKTGTNKEAIKEPSRILPKPLSVREQWALCDESVSYTHLLGKKEDGTIWLYRFSWWDDVTGAFYPMSNPTESDREWDEDVTEIMMLDRILPLEE